MFYKVFNVFKVFQRFSTFFNVFQRFSSLFKPFQGFSRIFKVFQGILKHFVKNVDCRFKDLYVDVDFVQIFVVDFRQKAKKIVESTKSLTPP
jgi:hypothetical protein